MTYLNRTFVSFYRFKEGKVSELLIRPEITIPKSPVIRGSFTPTDNSGLMSNMITNIVTIIEVNEFLPILGIVNEEEITTNLSALFLQALEDTTGNNTKASIKIGLAIANTGVNAGKGVLTISYRHTSGTINEEVIIDIEDNG